jgi:hypothetical protein
LFRILLYRAQAEWEKKYLSAVNKEFELQKQEIFDKHPEKNFSQKAMSDWLFDAITSKARFMATLTPLSIALMQSQAEYAFDLTGDDENLELQITQRMLNYIHERIDRFVSATNDETIGLIESSLAEGIKDGETLYKLKQRISEIYFNATTIRSERIARTETIAASNEAANEAYRQSPLTVAKEWHTEPDACEFCASLNGTIVGLDEEFVAQGEEIEGHDHGKFQADYESIKHPPLHPNCRCAILPVASD